MPAKNIVYDVVIHAQTTNDHLPYAASAIGVRRAGGKGDEVDRVAMYRAVARQVVEEYASYRPSHGQIDTEAIIDPERDHYEVVHVGWDGVRRVHASVIHLDIINGKIWIQYDGTSSPVAEELLAKGVPREEIVLGFHPAELRHHTPFAVG